MKGNMECKAYKELIMEEVDGFISKAGKAALKAHVNACADCEKHLINMKKIRKAVSKGYEVPAFLEAKIMAGIGQVPSSRLRALRFGGQAGLRVTSWFKPAFGFAASFGLVLLVSVFIMYRGMGEERVASYELRVTSEKTKTAEVAAVSDAKAEPETRNSKPETLNKVVKAETRNPKPETRNLNIDTYTEHGPSVKLASSAPVTAEKAPSENVVKTGETAGLAALKPGVIPTTTDNPLLDRELATVANNLINPLMGQAAKITVKVMEPANVKIVIYDKSVRPVSRILDEYKDRGTYEATWEGRTDDGKAVSEGVYFVYIQIGTRVIKKAVIVNK